MFKNVNQYSFDYNKSDYNDLISIAKTYRNVKNYVYSSFSGIHSYLKVYNQRKEIRDIWTKNDFIDNWGISRRYVRNAIEDATSDIKVSWKQTLKKTRKDINKSKLTKEERIFAYTMLKNKLFLFNILTNIKFDVDKFDNIDKLKIFKLIRRLIRKNKPIISKTQKLSMLIDSEMYSYDDSVNILITSLVKNKRFKFKVNTNDRFTGSIRIVIEDDRIRISNAINIKTKTIEYEQDRIGVDKNYINCFDTSNETSYGVKLNGKIVSLSDKLQEKNSKRQYYYNKIKEDKDLKKIDNIKKFNLGKKKYNRIKNALQEEIHKHVNMAVNQMILTEKPKEIIMEKLDFTSKAKKIRKKRINRLLSTWTKGYLQERVDYKAEENNIKIIECNAAYTSQECPLCHDFGHKTNDIFYCDNHKCDNHEGVNSGHASAKIVLQRSYDKEITLFTPYKTVKTILTKRLEELKTDPTKTS